MIYATTDELLNAPGVQEAPADPEGLLSAASALVTRVTAGAVYATFEDGTARDPRIRAALRGAAIAQAKFWAAHDLDPAAGALGAVSGGAVVSSKSIKGASVSYDTGAAREYQAARAAALVALCPPALLVLEAAGLTSGRVW